ncbi:MAG: RNA-binding S4 domain-containing protein [Gammaproteobacteria bacterium]|nr:RNA-binding S4 domain-containing protein [Gammaproteobacteria bacterium]
MEKLRIDKWLWAARFYKTRALATEAVSGGHIHVEGARVKPSREIKVGDQIIINKAPYSFELTILGLNARRGPAKLAQTLYEESETSRLKREEIAAIRRMERASNPTPDRRPDKRDRRRIIRFVNKNQ